MKVGRSIALWMTVVGAVLGLTTLTAQPASAAGDPCLTSGYVRTAWGDVGAAGWYAHAGYNQSYANSSPWGASNGVDHDLQWEMTYQASTRTVKFCAQNRRAIGRTALKISTESTTAGGAVTRTPLVDARGVSAGAGWVMLTSSHLPSLASYRVYLGDSWAGGSIHGWSNIVLRSYSCAAAAPDTTKAPSASVVPAGC